MGALAIPLLFLLFGTSLAGYTIISNYYWYAVGYTSECEASCLTAVFNQQQCHLNHTCSSDDCLPLDDSCLCSTISWLTATSQCIGESCGANAVYDAAAMAGNVCKTAGVEMAMLEEKFIQIGLAAVPAPTPSTTLRPPATTTTPPITPTPSTPTDKSPSEGSDNREGLNTRWQVVIGVIVSIVLVVTNVGVFFIWKRYKRTKQALTLPGESDSDLTGPSSSREALATLGAPPARGSFSELRESFDSTIQSFHDPEGAAAAPSQSTFTGTPDDQPTYPDHSAVQSDEDSRITTTLPIPRNANSSIAETRASKGRNIPGISELEAVQAIVPPPYQLHVPEPSPYG